MIKQLWGHSLRMLDLGLAILFGVWSVYVFRGIVGENRYRCFNEPNLGLARWEYVLSFLCLGYAIVRFIQYVRHMFQEDAGGTT